jgi:hypothetical protein
VDAELDRELSDEEAASVAVVEAIAETSNRDPQEIPPLYEAIDADALNRLCESVRVEVEFAYEGYTVTVCRANGVSVAPASQDRS